MTASRRRTHPSHKSIRRLGKRVFTTMCLSFLETGEQYSAQIARNNGLDFKAVAQNLQEMYNDGVIAEAQQGKRKYYKLTNRGVEIATALRLTINALDEL